MTGQKMTPDQDRVQDTPTGVTTDATTDATANSVTETVRDRQTALQVFELAPDATAEQIEKRYELLVRRYRHATDPDARQHLDRINAAYALLNPPPVPSAWQAAPDQRLVFGKTWAYWQNWFYYTRWVILAAVAGVAFVIYLIVTMVTNQPADFKVLLIGDYGVVSDEVAQDEVFTALSQSIVDDLQPQNAEIKKASVELIQLRYNADGSLDETADSQFQQANLMKAMAQLSSDDFDVIVLSQGAYANYAGQTDFVDLEPLLAQLSEQLPAADMAQLEILNRHPADSTFNDPTGVDVTALDPLAKLSMTGESVIVTVGPRSEQPELAQAWLAQWLSGT